MPEKLFDLKNMGLVLKLNPSALQTGQFMIQNNVDSFKEVSVNPRAGSHRYNGNNVPNWLLPHTLAKLNTGHGDAVDPRYVGEQSNIWRVTGPYTNDVLVSAGLGLGVNPNARWAAAPYSSGSSGNPYMFFAHPVRMMKDDSTWIPLRRWGIPPPTITPTLTLAGSASPGPDGIYTYLYTFRNPQTGAEGNPCALPVASATINPTNQGVTVKFWGAAINAEGNDPGDVALQGLGSIAIYRQGGTFADGLYRFVGFAENPGYVGGVPQFDNFLDTAPDINLINARTIEFDNDMPVTSSLPVPFVGNITSLVTTGAFTKIYLNSYPNYVYNLSIAWSPVNPQGFFTIGSQVTVGTSDNQETCIVFAVDATSGTGPHWIEVFLQNSHSANEQVNCDAVAGAPCDIICQYQDAILLAGDVNNPHVVYRSKSGRPDAFPVVDLEDGNAHELTVGSPSNPILGMAEFDGEVVVLNQKSISVFIVLNGAMSPPQETPSDRGLIAKNCWCKVRNQIWFLSYDGVYAWAGGESQLKTEAIHSIFNSFSTVLGDQTYYQIDYSPVRLAGFYTACIDQEVWMHYTDVQGNNQTLRYQLLYDRWLPANIANSIGAMLPEADTGRFIVGGQDSTPAGYLKQMLVGTSDDWTAGESTGAQIQWGFTTGYVSVEERTRSVQFVELVIEILNPTMGPGDAINFNLSYDYLTNPDGSAQLDPVDDFQISTPNAKRTFVSFPLQLSSIDGTASGKEAMSVSLTVSGNTTSLVQIFSWVLRFNPLQIPVKNSILDWQNLGTPNDKQLYCLALEYDPKGQQITLLLDIIAGVPGAQVPQVQNIVLQPAVWTVLQSSIFATDTVIALQDTTNIVVGTVLQIVDELLFVIAVGAGNDIRVVRGYLGTSAVPYTVTPVDPMIYSIGRVKQVFPIVDNVIAKSVRLRPNIPGVPFEIFDWKFEPIEQYPPDIVYFTELTDSGNPYLKYYNQLDISVDTGGVDVMVALELDGSNVFTFTVNTNRFTRYTNITCPRELMGVNARILPQLPLATGAKFQYWGVQYITEKAEPGPVSHSTDWDSLGTQFDKQLQTISFSYDGSAGDLTFQVDELSGINGDTIALAAILFTLTASNRGLQSFAFPKTHIVKALRVSPSGGVNVGFRSWGYAVTKIDFPPDVILWTDITDNGSPFLKFFNQVVLEVNTNNVPVTVLLELDGNIAWQFVVTSTVDTRRQAFVCPSQLSGINSRLVVQSPLPAGACFQLWGGQPKYVTEPADKGAVTHSYDWDRLDWPYDKRLKSIMFEYSAEAGDVTMQMQTIVGIGGVTLGPVLTFPLVGTARSLQQFGIADGVIAKAIRISPTTSPALDFREWKYVCEFDKYPPDFNLFTDRTTFGYPCEKTARNLIIDVDSGGVPLTIQIFGDGALKQTVTITTSVNDRTRVVALNSNLEAREWWLELAAGVGGKSQLFSWSLDYIKQPCSVTTFDTYFQDLGTFSYKWVRQCWLSYVAASPITVQIYVDNENLFWTQTLPAQPNRDMARFYLPGIDLTNTILNKSKVYRVVVTATAGTLQMYSDSVLEFVIIGQEQRVNRFNLTEREQLPVS